MIGKLFGWLLIAVLGAMWAYLYSMTSGAEQGFLIFVTLLVIVRTKHKCNCKETAQPAEG
jgi:hypothetical protein